MATYKFRAKKGPEKVIDSIIEASSRDDAIEKISQMGYMPVLVEKAAAGDAAAVSTNTRFSAQSVKSKQVTTFTRQLSILLRSGVPILKSLTILADQSLNPGFKAVLSHIRSEVKDGKTLSSALIFYPQIFSPLYISLVRSGEDSGTLEESLLRISEYRYKQEQIVSSIRTALTYPVLMAIVGTGTVIFMLVFVMPRLLKIFTRMGQELPLPTQILIIISNALTKRWVWVGLLSICIGIYFLIKEGFRSKKERLFLGLIQLRVPIFGELFLKAELARFSRTLEILLKSGIPLLKAIQSSLQTLDNEVLREQIRESYKAIEQGGSFGGTLNRTKIFPKFMVNLVIVGEESGKLEDALRELASTYENETDEAIKIMTNLLEPMMILVMGLIVGFIIVSMLLPVFQLNLMVT